MFLLYRAEPGWWRRAGADSRRVGPESERMAPATVTLSVNGKQLAQGRIKRSVPAVHTASESIDVGVDLGSPVSLDYHDRAPFRFNGEIEKIHIRYLEQAATK